MPLVTLRMTEEECTLLERMVQLTISRSRSEVIRDALMDFAERYSEANMEAADARRARKFYMPRRSRGVIQDRC